MSSKALKILAFATLVLALVLGYVAYRMSQGIGNAGQPSAQGGTDGQPASQLAVVAVKPIAAFTAIPADAVALVPVAILPEQYYTRVEEVVGHAPLSDIAMGVTVTQRYFRESNSLVNSIPEGYQAMSLEINDVIAVGGFVRPGDLVDVLLYIRSSGTEVQDSQARVLLRGARVLAYEDRVLNDAQGADSTSSEKQKQQQYQRRVRTAVVAVPEADTTRVMLGASLGELRLSLRPVEPGLAEAPMDATGSETQTIGTVGDAWPAAEPSAQPIEPADEKVVTLRELAGLKQKQAAGGGAAPVEHGVIIYRGSKVETVSQ